MLRKLPTNQNKPAEGIHPAVGRFAQGIEGEIPSDEVVGVAVRITEAAMRQTLEPEISVDGDGALSLDLRLANGLRMLAELPIEGSLDVGIYDDRDTNRRAREVEYLPDATDEDLIALL